MWRSERHTENVFHILIYILSVSLSLRRERHWIYLSYTPYCSTVPGKLNTDTLPQNFWTTFLDNDLTEKFKKSAVANTIAIPLPLCFLCFVPLRRFRENLTKPFYFYLSRTCDSPGGTPSVISLALRQCETHSQCVSLAPPREPLKLSLLHSIVFHIALRQCETHSQCVSLAPPREPLKLSLLHSILFHIALR